MELDSRQAWNSLEEERRVILSSRRGQPRPATVRWVLNVEAGPESRLATPADGKGTAGWERVGTAQCRHAHVMLMDMAVTTRRYYCTAVDGGNKTESGSNKRWTRRWKEGRGHLSRRGRAGRVLTT